MKTTQIQLQRFDADEGKVFDYKEPQINIEVEPETGNEIEVVQHLYAKTIYLGKNDTIENYIEVDAPVEEAAANEDTE